MGEGLQIERELRFETAILRSLTGRLDEHFNPEVFAAPQGTVLILDLEGVSNASSFGVREWIRAIRAAEASLWSIYFVKASPRILDQFNMVGGFDGGGHLLSFYAYFICDTCDAENRLLFDAQLDRAIFENLSDEPRACLYCGQEALLDDDPAVLFEYVRGTQFTPPPPVVVGALRSEGSWVAEIPGVRLQTSQSVVEEQTVFNLVGSIDGTFSPRRMVDSADGDRVYVDLRGVSQVDDAGAERFRDLIRRARARGELVLMRCPPPVLARAVKEPSLLAGARIRSLWLPGKCENCKSESFVGVLLSKVSEWLATGSRCANCQSPALKSVLAAADLDAFVQQAERAQSEEPDASAGGRVRRPVTQPPQPASATSNTSEAGRQEVLCRIGSGGMADVYLVRHHGAAGFRRLTVVKRIRPEHHTDDKIVRMFLEEARIAARITHENIIRVLDLGKSDEGYFMVMEYLHGQSLLEVLRRLSKTETPVDPATAAHIVAELCTGLARAHTPDSDGRNLVHRDVKPDNIVLTFDGGVKLVDFGLAGYARVFERGDDKRVMGTPLYLPPEAYTDGEFGPTGDIWAAGIVLYSLLTLAHPYKRPSQLETARAIAFEFPSRRRDRVPRSLNAIIKKAQAKNPKSRYQQAADMARDLRAAIAKLGEPQPIGAWLRSLFPEQVALEQEFVAAQGQQTIGDTLLRASPQDVSGLFERLAGDGGAVVDGSTPTT